MDFVIALSVVVLRSLSFPSAVATHQVSCPVCGDDCVSIRVAVVIWLELLIVVVLVALEAGVGEPVRSHLVVRVELVLSKVAFTAASD